MGHDRDVPPAPWDPHAPSALLLPRSPAGLAVHGAPGAPSTASSRNDRLPLLFSRASELRPERRQPARADSEDRGWGGRPCRSGAAVTRSPTLLRMSWGWELFWFM